MTRAELHGIEFDWFALDKNNNIAFISSAGHGDIPDIVIQHHEAYENISESLLTPHYGSTQIWDDYANYGLFVYDWKLYQGHYEKMREPQQEIARDLKKRILSIPHIPIIAADFCESAAIGII